MVDGNDDAKGGGYRRVEVLTGPGRRRNWSDADKARIVGETLEPGAVVAEGAGHCPAPALAGLFAAGLHVAASDAER